MCTAGISKLIDVQCKFMFKSDCKILSYGRFKILIQACPSEVRVQIQIFLFLRFISQLLLKFPFLKFNMFNRSIQTQYFQTGFSFFLTSKSLI